MYWTLTLYTFCLVPATSSSSSRQQLYFCVMKARSVELCAPLYYRLKNKFHSTVQLVYQRSFPNGLKHVGSQIQYLCSSPALR